MLQFIFKVIFIITVFIFGGTQAHANFTHIQTSAAMIDSDTLGENSAVSIDNTLGSTFANLSLHQFIMVNNPFKTKGLLVFFCVN